jgi:regulator-associated protein of mTOR
MGSMNGEVRIWDVRAPEKPLYESVAQSHGLAGLAVHAGAPVLATYVSIPSWVSSTLISRTSAPSHDLRQRLVIQGFSDPTKPKTLSRLSIPLSPNVGGPQRPVGFMPSAASLAFHPVSLLPLQAHAPRRNKEADNRSKWWLLLVDSIRAVQSRCSSAPRQKLH